MRKWIIPIILAFYFGVSLFFVSGCGAKGDRLETADEVEASGHANTAKELAHYQLYLDLAVDVTDQLMEHEVAIAIDDDPIVIPAEKYFTKLIDLEEGNHTISFICDGVLDAAQGIAVSLEGDRCLRCTLGYSDEELWVDSVEIIDSIADSAIEYEDVQGKTLTDALSALEEKHFVNVNYFDIDAATILNPEDWEVVGQNVNPGDVLDKTASIELTCKQVYFQVYFDLAFDQNLLFAKYGLDFYLDGQKYATLAHGQDYTKLTRVYVGEHEMSFKKEDNNEIGVSKSFSISQDATVKGTLHTNAGSVEFNDYVLLNSVIGASLEVPKVTGMVLSDALVVMGNSGFSNVREEPYNDIWDRNNWMVVSQSLDPGITADKNERITIDCIKITDYLSENYLLLTISEAEKQAEVLGNKISFRGYLSGETMDETIPQMTEPEKMLWIVRRADLESGCIILSLIYKGEVEFPDLKGKNLAEALEEVHKKGFSGVEAKAKDGSIIFDNSNWTVVTQSVKGGTKVIANGRITLTVVSNYELSDGSSVDSSSKNRNANSDDDEDSVSYSTNNKKDVKLGKSGIYAYAHEAPEYTIYYIIDFDEGYVYYFTDPDSDSCMKVKIDSGTLNDGVVVTYHDGGDVWQEGLSFKFRNQPDRLVVHDSDGFEWSYSYTNLEDALKIRDQKTIYNY